MRIVFMGTGEIAVPAFTALLQSGYSVAGLVTQPDRPVGRHQVMTPPPLKPLAESAGVPVLQPESMRNEEAVAALAALSPDIIVVMAYGQILNQAVLDTARLAIVNLHASLLPLYRGASCIQGPLARGDEKTGVTLMHVVRALDAGDVIARAEYPLTPQATGGAVHDDLAGVAADLLMSALPSLADGTAPREVQDESQMTYVPKLLRKDGELDWTRSASELERLIRAYSPWPGTFTTFYDAKGRRKNLKIYPHTEVSVELGVPGTVLRAGVEGLVVACGEGALTLLHIQPEGGKMMSAEQFLCGCPALTGQILGSSSIEG